MPISSIDVLAISRFIPHGHCYLWKTNLVWLHVTSDLLISIAYYSISVTLLYFVSQRVDLPYPRVFLLFAAFIFCCGTTHLMEIWTLWYPTYWISGFLKAITALVSIDTAIEIIPLIPKLLALPSPNQLERANQQLQKEIIQHKQTEKALQESEKHYRAIVEDQTELVVRFENDQTLVFVNDAYCRYFNQKKAELIGKKYQPLIHPEDRHKRNQLLNSLNSENPIGYVEYRVIVNQEIRWMRWSYRQIFDEQNNLVDLQSVGRDIGDRIRAEQDSQKRESILRSFYESAPMMMGIVKIAEENVIPISCNKTATEFFNSTSNTTSIQSIKTKSIFADWSQHFYNSQLQEEPVHFEYYAKNTHEDNLCFSVTISLIKELIDDHSWFCYVAEDITEERQARILKQKEILLKEMHHRVKNNLQIICSLLNLQSRIAKQPFVTKQFQEIKDRVTAISLVHEQLYQSEDIFQIALSSYIPTLADNLFRSYFDQSRHIDFDFQIDQNILLEIDIIISLGLIINELLSNAIKYAFEDSKKGLITIQARKDSESNIILIVSDNGKGLDPSLDLEKPKTLGLKLVKSLINQLRGKLEITKDLGTHFKITLALAENNSAEQQSKALTN